MLLSVGSDQDDEILEYCATLEGELQGVALKVKGNGTIDEKRGLTRGEYRLHEVPENFDPHFLTAVLVTGYPNACAELNGFSNPFRRHSYEYERELKFSTGQGVRIEVTCKIHSGKLISTFFLKGTMPSLAISSVEPIVEAWVPTQGRIAGRFTAAWRTPLGEIASAEAESNYQIKSRKKMTQLVHRFIDIDARVDGRKFTLDQRSFTFQRLFVDALTCGVSERR